MDIGALKEWLAIPSVSADPAHDTDTLAAAQWLVRELETLGAQARLIPTAGHPAVYGGIGDDPQRVTVLLYGHYDVQPAGNDSLWTTPAFTPTERQGRIYARGAADDKAQVYMHLAAFKEMAGNAPVNIRILIEGEEETGSPNLGSIIAEHKELFAADVVLVSDTGMPGADAPTLCLGTRGIAHFSCTVTGPARDLHSGTYGGIVENPIHSLAQAIASLHGPDGEIAVEGFDIAPKDQDIVGEFSDVQHDTGAKPKPTRYSPAVQTGMRPSIDVTGMWGGHIGPGSKTIIPSMADAKISIRLVPEQDAARAAEAVRQHLERNVREGTTISFTSPRTAPAFRQDADHLAVRLALDALEETHGKKATIMYSGGSIPVLALLQEQLKTPIICLGFSLPEDNIHGPNESFSIAQLERGTRTLVRYYTSLQNLK